MSDNEGRDDACPPDTSGGWSEDSDSLLEPVQECEELAQRDGQRGSEHGAFFHVLNEDALAGAAVMEEVDNENGLLSHDAFRLNPDTIPFSSLTLAQSVTSQDRNAPTRFLEEQSCPPVGDELSQPPLSTETQCTDHSSSESEPSGCTNEEQASATDGHEVNRVDPSVSDISSTSLNQAKTLLPDTTSQNCSTLMELPFPTENGIEETHPTVTSFPVHAMPSFRQMSVPISELEIIKSAVFKIKCTYSDCYGHGTFVLLENKDHIYYFFLTSIRSLLTEEEGKRRKQLEGLRRTLMARCKDATYEAASRLELTAGEVLLDSDKPAICFDQDKDLMAIMVKDPQMFAVEPLQLMTSKLLSRERLLEEADLFYIMHYSSSGDLMITLAGPKYPNAEQGTFRYRCDTGEGASGAPVLYSVGGCFRCFILMGIHVQESAQDVKPYSEVASLLNKTFFEDMKKLGAFFHVLNEDAPAGAAVMEVVDNENSPLSHAALRDSLDGIDFSRLSLTTNRSDSTAPLSFPEQPSGPPLREDFESSSLLPGTLCTDHSSSESEPSGCTNEEQASATDGHEVNGVDPFVSEALPFSYQPKMLPPPVASKNRSSNELHFSIQDYTPSTVSLKSKRSPVATTVTTTPPIAPRSDNVTTLPQSVLQSLSSAVVMSKFFGQRSVPYHLLARAASAVCRIVWKMQTESKSLYGTGSFVSCMGKKYFLTCCHNFFEKKDGPKLSSLSDHDLNRMITNRCRRTQFLCSTRDFRDTVALKADIVLTNHQDPVVIFDKVHDLLAIEVNDPADFPRHLGAAEKAALLPIQPIPFHPHPKRESLPDSALFLTIVHFPRKDIKRAECLQFAMGPRLIQGVCQDTLVVYNMDTYHGSSGGPVFIIEGGEVVLLAVHRKSTGTKMKDETGERTRIGYKVGSALQDFQEKLI